MDTVEAASTLLTHIQILVEAANVCEVTVYQVTAGEPAQPSGEGPCATVSVWVSSYFNGATSMFHEDNPCLFIRAVHLNWRLDVCYTETEAGPTPAQHLTDAVCLYGLADAIYCGLPGRNLFDLQCSDLQFDELFIGERSGGYVSASSGVRFQLPCVPAPVVVDVVGSLAGLEEGQDFG